MKYVIFTDGGARGNPGPAGIGIAIFDEQGQLVKKIARYLGERTNNEAEYEAVLVALDQAAKLGAAEVVVNVDSELVARQLNNIYRVKNKRMQALVVKVRNTETKFKKVTYKHIPREKNELADQLVNRAIDEKSGRLPDLETV